MPCCCCKIPCCSWRNCCIYLVVSVAVALVRVAFVPQEHVRLVPSAFVLPAIPAAGVGASAGPTAAAATALAVFDVPIVVAAVLPVAFAVLGAPAKRTAAATVVVATFALPGSFVALALPEFFVALGALVISAAAAALVSGAAVMFLVQSECPVHAAPLLQGVSPGNRGGGFSRHIAATS